MADEKLKAKTSETQSSELMKHAKSQTYCAKEDPKDKTNAGHHAMDNCIELFKLDYDVEIIDNTGGKLCSHYPAQIVLMGEKRRQECPVRDAEGQQLTLEKARKTLQDVMEKAAASRCRFRFVTPVIYFNGQYVCRSATLAGSKELTLRMASDTVNSAAEAVISTAGAVASTAVGAGAKIYEVGKGWLSYSSAVFWWGGKTDEVAADETDGSPPAEADAGDLSRGTETGSEEAKANLGLYEEYFRNKVDKDKELLQKLNVLHICDLMVEEAKVKYGMVFSSSEKSDQEQRYRDFKLYGFPYPGCEFFADWNANDRRAKGLHYTWHESRNDAVLNVGEPKSVLRELEIDWGKMREWDLEQLTLNYVQALVKLVATGEHGLLVHCISGWDRTPLFISLLRLSLWADGLIHPSLEPAEMMYLTLAYDWYLFGGQWVLPFCFIMLPKLADQRFSAHSYGTFPGKPSPMKSPTPSSGSKLSPTLRRSTRLSEKEQGAQPSAAADNRFWPYPSKSQSAQETSTRHPKTKATTSKSALSSPSKTAVSAAVSPRSKSHSPSRVTSVSSVSMEGRAAAGGGVDLSPSKGLAEGLSALSAASPTKRRSTEKEPGPGSASPAKKVSSRSA
ncbi:phosphatidylinositol-3,5-bisphosphate 3-phosphatase MTMR14-like [Babylonia areolata]|uniref:phosphatidylinositol-3,5-bisphosphate 3-phosphatase MTMR14-like n=1 Tax=Babylonia areolata TaxID=304850 RepID=UPI003FD00F9A